MKGAWQLRPSTLAQLGSLALLLLLVGTPTAPAFAQNERPDLAVELLPFDPAKPRAVRVRVTNVGQWWADKTSVTVETVAPSAGNKVTQAVPDLDPKQNPQGPTDYRFELTYTLVADCDGHTVKASLTAAKTFNGNAESNLGNNTAGPVKLCDAKIPSKPPIVQSGGVVLGPIGESVEAKPEPAAQTKIDNALIELPWHMRNGPQRHVFNAVDRFVTKKEWSNPPLIRGPGSGLCTRGFAGLDDHVGFEHRDSDDCYYALVVQTAVVFDLRDMRLLVHHLKRATFEFDEQIIAQRTADGGPSSLFTCVRYVGLLTAQPDGWNGLYPHEEDLQNPGFGGITMTGHVRRMIANPDHDFGLMIGGLQEGNAEDEEACLSLIRFPRLVLEYDVLGIKQ